MEANLNKAKETLASLPQGENIAAPTSDSESVAAVVDEATKAQVVVKYLTDALCFARQLRDSVPIISQLLGSKISSDVTEAIEFFMTASSFQVDNSILGLFHLLMNMCVSIAIAGVRKMLALMWSKDASIRDSVMNAYKILYLSPDAAQFPTPRVCFR